MFCQSRIYCLSVELFDILIGFQNKGSIDFISEWIMAKHASKKTNLTGVNLVTWIKYVLETRQVCSVLSISVYN